MKPGSIADRLISILFPKRCVLCETTVEFDDFVCTRCACSLPKKGIAFQPMDENVIACALAALYYDGKSRNAMLRLKTERSPDMRAVFFFANEMWRTLQQAGCNRAFDCITAVPQSNRQKHQRTCNPAILLADRLSQISGIPCVHDILIRSDDSRQQHNLKRAERLANALESYSSVGSDRFSGRNVLLIDDIYTTGATCYACARQILKAGAEKVCVLTAMLTPAKESE